MSYNESQFDYNDRYGISSRGASSPKSLRIAAIIFIVVLTSWVIWAGLHHARPILAHDLIAFENSDPRNPTIRYSITRRDAAAEVICTLTARDFDKNIVGQIDDVIAAGARSVERTIVIPTRADAVNVGVARCRIR
jgi:hypothetical protein